MGKTKGNSSKPTHGGRGRGRGGRAARAVDSDSSLDEDLQDYLENVHREQQQHDSSSEEDQEGQQPRQQPACDSIPADADDPDSWRPTGLGYHSTAAATAAQFAGTSLDDMLEGDLAADMQQAWSDGDDDSTSNSSTSSDDDSTSDTGSESDDSGSGAGAADPADTTTTTTRSQPVVVDASGRQQSWHALSLEQRFPVQARQQQSPSAAGGASSSGRRNNGNRKQGQAQQPHSSSTRAALAERVSADMLLSNRQGFVPGFESDALAAAVDAATAAAATLAKQQVAQYAELAQQLQQTKQNPSNRPGRKGKGAKKQLKKAKVSAKRTAKEARSHSGALQLLAAVARFAGSGQDMQVLPPCGSRQKEVGGAWVQWLLRC